MTTLNTSKWHSFPFEVNGMKFVSKISKASPFLFRIANLPIGAFEQMNCEAVKELIGESLSREYVESKLVQINKGASHAVLELAE